MATIRPQIAATPVPLRETAQQKMARQQVIRSKQMFNRPVKQLKSATPPLGSPITPEIAARNKALQTPIWQNTATPTPGSLQALQTPLEQAASAPQTASPVAVAQVMPGQIKKGSTGLPTGPSNNVQLEADARRNMAMAQKQAATPPQTGSPIPPDTAMPAVMAKGGMVKKPAAKKMAKGGVVIKANCGASVPPTQKYKK